MDPEDRIYIQGVSTSQLSFQAGISHESNLGETLSGIGIFADNVLEAVYVGDSLDVGQMSHMFSGTLWALKIDLPPAKDLKLVFRRT